MSAGSSTWTGTRPQAATVIARPAMNAAARLEALTGGASSVAGKRGGSRGAARAPPESASQWRRPSPRQGPPERSRPSSDLRPDRLLPGLERRVDLLLRRVEDLIGGVLHRLQRVDRGETGRPCAVVRAAPQVLTPQPDGNSTDQRT